MIMMFGCFKKPEVDKESSILTIEEAKTIAVGDECKPRGRFDCHILEGMIR